MKVAIVHEWFLDYMGSEKCVESFTNLWPDAEVFALFDFLNTEHREKILKGKKAKVSYLQNFPFIKKHFRNYFPLFPFAVEQHDVSGNDIVLSSSHSFAKGIITSVNQLHICYCHTPIRYVWDLYHQYLKESNLDRGLKGYFAKRLLHKIRLWDSTTANRVDYFIANSNHVAKRILKIYGKKAEVIFPPVDTERFEVERNKDDYYLVVSRFVPYKKVDLIVKAFSQMPDKKLVVIGDGPDSKKVKEAASKNIELLGHQPFPELKKYMQKAKAFVFAAEEDFGITNVESMACGTPVIAYKIGGSSDSVIHSKTGMLFEEQNTQSIIDAVNSFEKNSDNFDPFEISKHAESFSRKNFEAKIKSFVEKKYEKFRI